MKSYENSGKYLNDQFFLSFLYFYTLLCIRFHKENLCIAQWAKEKVYRPIKELERKMIYPKGFIDIPSKVLMTWNLILR